MVEDIITPIGTTKCTDCSLWQTSQVGSGLFSCNKLMGQGSGSIMFIDSTPKEEEIKQKKPFIGIEGQLLKKCAIAVGIKEAYYTYVCKCKPAFQKTIGLTEIDACAKHLIEEIDRIKPKVIVALGNTVLQFFDIEEKITQIRGRVIWNEEFKCYIVPTYSPAYINNFTEVSHQRNEFNEDLSKALKVVNEGYETKKLEVNYKYASTIVEVEWMVKQLLQSEYFSADTEFTSLDYFRVKLLLNSFSPEIGTAFVIPYLHPKGFDEQGQKEVKPYLEKIYNSVNKKIFQFGKIDIQVLMTTGIPIQGYAFDVGLAHALLDENSSHGLDKLVPIYTDMGNYKDETTNYIRGNIKVLAQGVIQKGKDYFLGDRKIYMAEAFRNSTILDCPYEQLLQYSAQDADATLRLYKKFLILLERENLLPLLTKIMVPLSSVLAKMEYEGIGGNLGYANQMATKLRAEMSLAETSILTSKQIVEYMNKYQVKAFNVNSPKQKSELLFDIMQLKPTKFNKVTAIEKAKGAKKGSPSTDSHALELLLQENKFKVLEDLIKIGKLKKSKEYMEEYEYILSTSADGRIHTSYNQVKTEEGGTIAGRLSSKGPNLQNIPSHNPEKAKAIRTVFVSRPGFTFIEADYSVIEFRVWAHASKDVKMLEFLNTPGLDIHKKIASQAYRITEEQVTKTLRDIAKQTVYGMIYGRSTYSIAKEYGMDEDEVSRFVNGFFKMFPEATQYIDDNILLMEKQGYIANLFGRRRRALNIYSKDKLLKASAQRQARNFNLQSGAADIIYVAMIKLEKALLPYQAKMILQIHDSLVVEIKDEQLDIVVPIVKKVMETAVPLKCKTPVEVEIGKCLGDMKAWEKKENFA